MKNRSIEIKWGILFTIIALLWMVLEKSMGLHSTNIEKHAIYTNFFAIPAIAVYVFALLDKRKNHYNGKMTWLQGFISGLIITAVVAILSPLSQYITHSYISPEYFENVINFMIETDKMEPEQAREYFNLKNYIVQSVLGGIVMGIVTSLIIALFTRKK